MRFLMERMTNLLSKTTLYSFVLTDMNRSKALVKKTSKIAGCILILEANELR